MPRAVLLHHLEDAAETGFFDHSCHWDLLLERGAGSSAAFEPAGAAAEHCLVAFRLDEPLNLLEIAEFRAVRIRDHRAAYLDYEGPLPAPRALPAARSASPTAVAAQASSARGAVTRVWTATCWIHFESPEALDFTIEQNGMTARFTGERMAHPDPRSSAAPGRHSPSQQCPEPSSQPTPWWFTRC